MSLHSRPVMSTPLGMENNKNFKKTVSLIFSPLTEIFVKRGMQTQTLAKPPKNKKGSQNGEKSLHKEKKCLPHRVKDSPPRRKKPSHRDFSMGIVCTLTQQGPSPPPLPSWKLLQAH